MDFSSGISLPRKLQELRPEQARSCLKVARFLQKDLCLDLAGTHVLVCFSGGADSTFLLLSLYYLIPQLGFSLCAAHLDHGLRPSSAQEALWCQSVCEKLDIPFYTEKRDIGQDSGTGTSGLEEKARNVRYDFFNAAALNFASDWIVTGHTQNDLAEDVLMRLIRGAGWPGLGGMPAVDQERRLLRPLLAIKRKDIEKFLTALNFPWIEDESNTDRSFFRNRIRKDLLPAICAENPSFLDTTFGLWQLARIDDKLFDTLFEQNMPPDADGCKTSGIVLPSSYLSSLPKGLRMRLYMRVLKALGPGQTLMKNLLALDETWLTAHRRGHTKGGGQHQFPGGKTAIINKHGITWSHSTKK